MAVIVRQTTTFDGNERRGVKVYRSVRPVSNEMKSQAEALDRFLAKKMRDIRNEMRENGLLDLKGKPGVLPLWHAVGLQLALVDDASSVSPEDRAEDRYIWEALWHHAGDLAPGEERKSAGTDRDHWRMCYRLAKQGPLDWVHAVGTWRDWVELLESPFVNADPRILDWIGTKMKAAPKRLLRDLTRCLRNKLKNCETRNLLTDEELRGEMEECWKEIFSADHDHTAA